MAVLYAVAHALEIQVVDVFAMPQSGTTITVESVDHVFQTRMMDMLKQTGRPEAVVGWYHSHPGFGCWLSGIDCNTQQVRARGRPFVALPKLTPRSRSSSCTRAPSPSSWTRSRA